jgi:hypothetical protein
VREATRFKASRGAVDVPARDRQVIAQAVETAPQYHLPRVIARAVYSAIINASVNFELCVVRILNYLSSVNCLRTDGMGLTYHSFKPTPLW